MSRTGAAPKGAPPPPARPAVRYALGPEDKEARRDAIVAAARTLFLAHDGALPSAARIAEAAGLAKGTVYLYFRTKEEIFAALLIAEWGALLDEVDAAFGSGPGGVAATVAAFRARYVRHLARRPELLRLDALGYAVLEKNLGPEELRAFKLALVERLTRAGAVVDARLALPAGRGLELLMRTYALTRGLWQMLDYSGDAAALMAEPALAPMRPDFWSELVRALDEYWRGALATGARDAHTDAPGRSIFTGSIPIRKRLAAAGRVMKPVTTELGGHAPTIVCGDVDVAGQAVRPGAGLSAGARVRDRMELTRRRRRGSTPLRDAVGPSA